MMSNDESDARDRFRLRGRQSVNEFLELAYLFMYEDVVLKPCLRERLQDCFMIDLTTRLQEAFVFELP
jgi:hypothetical protein